jgi:hypothetical protein
MTRGPIPRNPDEGSIYDGRSPVGQRALASLRSVLQDSGFVVEKERQTERTLRVYPERRWRYPLLNPRFVSAGRRNGVLLSTAAILFEVYSDRDEWITDSLKRLPLTGEWTFRPAVRREARGRYKLHGRFIIPIAFVGDRHEENVDFEYLRTVFGALHLELTAALFRETFSHLEAPSA